MRQVTVAATQMACGPDAPANIARAEKLVRAAAAQGAQIILIQELFESLYFCQDQIHAFFDLAKPLEENAAVKHFAPIAKELGVVLPISVFERAGQSFFNTIVIPVSYTHLDVYKRQPQGGTANKNDSLDTESLTGSYLWHQMFGVTEAYTNITGNADSGLYNSGTSNANGKPNTDSFTTELDYYPFNTDGPKFFPWVNAKFFVENTIYPTFNGLAHNYEMCIRDSRYSARRRCVCLWHRRRCR